MLPGWRCGRGCGGAFDPAVDLRPRRGRPPTPPAPRSAAVVRSCTTSRAGGALSTEGEDGGGGSRAPVGRLARARGSRPSRWRPRSPGRAAAGSRAGPSRAADWGRGRSLRAFSVSEAVRSDFREVFHGDRRGWPVRAQRHRGPGLRLARGLSSRLPRRPAPARARYRRETHFTDGAVTVGRAPPRESTLWTHRRRLVWEGGVFVPRFSHPEELFSWYRKELPLVFTVVTSELNTLKTSECMEVLKCWLTF